MSTATRPGTSNPSAHTSPWRLVNLSLGIAAPSSLAGLVGYIPPLKPTGWFLAPFISPGTLQAASPIAVFAARVGSNTWMLASLLMILWWALRLHRKLEAPVSKNAQAGLVVAWAGSVAATWVWLNGTPYGLVNYVFFGFLAGIIAVVLFLTGIVCALVEWVSMLRYRKRVSPYVPIGLICCATIPPILLMMPLLLG
jgi:hypothetical protein